MKLTRTMEVEVDLPEAPEGCEWILLSDYSHQIRLSRNGIGHGFVTGAGELGTTVSWRVYSTSEEGEAQTQREAALALFAALGLEAP